MLKKRDGGEKGPFSRAVSAKEGAPMMPSWISEFGGLLFVVGFLACWALLTARLRRHPPAFIRRMQWTGPANTRRLALMITLAIFLLISFFIAGGDP
jgi:hypothetical protein